MVFIFSLNVQNFNFKLQFQIFEYLTIPRFGWKRKESGLVVLIPNKLKMELGLGCIIWFKNGYTLDQKYRSILYKSWLGK